ncbi:MAG: hypothetical protein RMJ31_00595 [Nitrososphaerota archaeon]|nr:hypothetical protein [Nitrososphaerales archaeon]MDW8044262.1 hypothetical protein [Nitrososphaerota archaeon]
MGRKSVIFGIWLLGFVLGFIGYLVLPWIGKWFIEVIPYLVKNEVLFGAFITGIAGSIITTISVAIWARFSEKRSESVMR